MEDTEVLARKLAEVRETLRQLTARADRLPAMRIPISRLKQQEAKLLELIRVAGGGGV